MAAGETITQRIALDGAEDIKRQLAEMGSAGEQAIKAIDNAVNQANSGTTRFASGVAAVRERVGQMRESFAPLHEALGNVHERFTQLGEKVNQLSETVFPHFHEILALATAGGIAGFLKLTEGAAASVREIENSALTLGMSVQDYEAFKLVAAESGVEVEGFTRALGRMMVQLGKAHEDQIKLTGSTGEGVQTLRGGAQQLANASAVLKGSVDSVASSHDKLNHAVESTVTTLRGGIHAVQDFSTPFNSLQMSINNLDGSFKKPVDIVREFATRLTGLKDTALQAAVGSQAMGRSWVAQLPALQNLSERLESARHRVESFGIGVEKSESAQAKAFNRAFATLKEVSEGMERQIFNIFGQALLPVMEFLTKAMGDNMESFKHWADEVTHSVLPVVEDLVNFLSGKGAPQTDFLRGLIPVMRQIGEGAKIAFGILKAGFDAIVFVLNPIAALINEVFGTEFTGTTLAAAGVILSLVGVIGLVSSAIMAVVAVGGLLVAFFTSWPAVAVAATIAILSTIYAFRDDIVRNLQEMGKNAQMVWDQLGRGFAQMVDEIKTYWTNGLNWIGGMLDYLKQKALDLLSLVGMASSDSSAALFAGGGPVSGPAGRDRVPAMLTAGEFVVRQPVVSYLGANFFAALNAYPEKFAHMLSGFNLGGLVSQGPRLAFAEGGVVPSMRGGLTLVLDGQRYEATADDHVLTSLTRTARRRQMTSTGRKPGWFGG